MTTRSVYVHLRAKNSQYNAEMAKSGRITKMAMGVSERAVADNSKALRDMERDAGGLQKALSKPMKPKVDNRTALRDIETVDDRLNKLTFRKALVSVAIAGLPVAVAGMGVLTAAAAGTAALFATAGAGAVGFGVVAKQSMKRVTDASKELEKADADRAAILGSLSVAQRESVRDLDHLKTSWTSFQDQTDPAVLGAMGNAMQALQAAMPGLAGLVTPVASAFGDFMGVITRNVSSAGFTAFMSDMGTMAGGLLANLGKAAINAGYGVGQLVKTFSGLAGGISEGLVGLTDKFASWSEGLASSGGFQKFMDYVREVGPQLGQTLGHVATALLDIAQAVGPLGGPMLTAVDSLARMVTAVGNINPAILTAVAGFAIFTAASRTIGSAMIVPMQRMRAMKTEMAGVPTAAGRAKVAMTGLGSAMGGKRGIAGAAGLGITALSGMANTSTTTGKAISTLGSAASGALLGFSVGGPWGAAIGGGAGLLVGLGSAFLGSGDAASKAAGENVDYASTLNRVSGAVTRTTGELVAQRLEQQGVLETLQGMNLDPGLGVEAALGDPIAMQRIGQAFDTQISSMVSKYQDLMAAQRAGHVETAAEMKQRQSLMTGITELRNNKAKLLGQLGVEGGKLKSQQASYRRTSAAADGYGASSGRAARETETLTHAVNRLMQAQQEQAARALAAADKNIAYEQSLADARKEARKGAKTLDITTQAGRDNRTSLDGVAAAWDDLGAKAQNARGAYKNARQDFIQIAMAMGATEKQAKRLADRLLEQPKKIVTKSELDKRDAERDARILKSKFGEIPETVPTKAKFDSQGARNDVSSWVGFFNKALNGIDDEKVGVQLSASAKSVISGVQGILGGGLTALGLGGKKHASGGPINGPGSGTSDDIPAMLSDGEHVLTAKEVKKAGGHEAVYAIRRMLLNGQFAKRGDVPGYFATGGPVVSTSMSQRGTSGAMGGIGALFDKIAAGIGSKLSSKLNDLFKFGGGMPLGPGGSLSPGQIVRGQQFAQAQNGKPYIWGGVGPAGYDCSGFQSAIINASLGRSPYSRIGSTSSMPWPGFKSGPGAYTIGWFTGDPGHTSGNIGGLGVESTGDHVRTGSAARSPLSSMFNNVAHYDQGGPLKPGWTAAYNGTGRDEQVVRLAGGGDPNKDGKKTHKGPKVPAHWRDEILSDVRRRYGKNSEVVQAITSWLESMKFRDYSQAKLAAKIDKIVGRGTSPALRQFGLGDTRSEMRQEVRELHGALRQTLGKDAPILKKVDRLGERMVHATGRMQKLERAQEKANARLDRVNQSRRELAGNVASNFRTDPFGGSLADFSLQVRADTNDSRRMRRALRKARHRGLSGGLYQQLATSGNFNLAQQFAHLSRHGIRGYERQFADRNQASGRLGRMVGHEIYGHRIRENSRHLHHLNQEIHRLNRRLEKFENRVEHAVERGTRAGNKSGGANRKARAGA